jgi:3-hydroxy-9,10-secoandrosta-1,3,5(10)-triene-9,17-dione monooxygenase
MIKAEEHGKSTLRQVSVARPSEQELIARAKALVPVLRERSASIDSERKLPLETLADFKKAGFHLIGQPLRYGGYGYGQDVIAKVSRELSRGCGASGWLGCFFANHNMLVAMFPEQVQEEVWGGGKESLIATISTGGVIRFDDVDGGRRVNADVKFSSGVDYADWLIMIHPEGLYLLPRKDFEIKDDWYVMGMKGTGSKSVVIKDAVVPTRRIITPQMLGLNDNYGARHYDAIHFGLPFAVWTPTCQTSVVIGMTRGIVELFDEQIRKRKDSHTGQPAIHRPGWQMRFAEASAELEAAEAVFDRVFEDMEKWHGAGGDVSTVERARVRRNMVFATKLCVQATNRLFDGGDASVVYDKSPIQRFFRDIRAVSISVSQVWDEPAMQFSRVNWGLPQETMF